MSKPVLSMTITKRIDEAIKQLQDRPFFVGKVLLQAKVAIHQLQELYDRRGKRIEELAAIADRPLHDDLNVLLARCENQEPLSLAEQREMYAWLEERDGIIGDYDEKIERLEAIVGKLPKTADGVSVVPNEHYWIITPQGVERVLVLAISFSCDGWWCNGHDGEGYTPEDDLWSTREAAEAAGGE